MSPGSPSMVFCISFSCAAGISLPSTTARKYLLRSRGVEMIMPAAPDTDGSISVTFASFPPIGAV